MLLVNLLPWRQHRAQKIILWLYLGGGLIAGIGIIIVLVIGDLLQQRIMTIQQLFPQAERALQQSTNILNQRQQILVLYRSEQACQQLAKQRRTEQQRWMLLWQQLPKLLPAGLWLSSLTYQQQRLSITGASFNSTAISDFRFALEQYFAPAHIGIEDLKRTRQGDFRFSLSLQLPSFLSTISSIEDISLCFNNTFSDD